MEGKSEKVGGKHYKMLSHRLSSPNIWLFEPTKSPDDRANYYLDCSFLPQCKHRVLVFTLEWSGARPMGKQWRGLGPISIPSDLGYLVSLPEGKPDGTSEFRTRDLSIPSLTLCLCDLKKCPVSANGYDLCMFRVSSGLRAIIL